MEENTALNENETAYFIPFHWAHNGLKLLMKLHWFLRKTFNTSYFKFRTLRKGHKNLKQPPT